MPKIDVYLRSLERFGASGAVLASGQTITLRFPAGDRQATQVTPHDQLVALVREIAPPPALEQIDANRPANFEFDSNGIRYAFAVSARPGAWSVAIDPVVPPAPVETPRVARTATKLSEQPASAPAEMAIERGQYAEPAGASVTSGGLFDQLTAAARAVRATDVFLSTGNQVMVRVGGELQTLGDRGSLDAEALAREIGIVAPDDARSEWTERGVATFAYNDGAGRVRATIVRDHRGPAVALRLLVGEAPGLDRLGIADSVAGWLGERGLILVGGTSGSGKTTTLAACVRALGDQHRRVVVFEDPIEIVQTGPTVSQRALRVHVPSLAEGVASAMREGADAIVIATQVDSEAATAIVTAITAGHLVLATVASEGASDAATALADYLPQDRRDAARVAISQRLIGSLAATTRSGVRSFEAVGGRG